jgi:hypothetical protein
MSVDLMTINYIGQKVVVSVSLDELARNPEQVIADLASKGFGSRRLSIQGFTLRGLFMRA